MFRVVRRIFLKAKTGFYGRLIHGAKRRNEKFFLFFRSTFPPPVSSISPTSCTYQFPYHGLLPVSIRPWQKTLNIRNAWKAQSTKQNSLKKSQVSTQNILSDFTFVRLWKRNSRNFETEKFMHFAGEKKTGGTSS